MFIIFSYLELELMCVWLFVGAAWDNGVCSLCVVLCVFRMKAAVKLCDTTWVSSAQDTLGLLHAEFQIDFGCCPFGNPSLLSLFSWPLHPLTQPRTHG